MNESMKGVSFSKTVKPADVEEVHFVWEFLFPRQEVIFQILIELFLLGRCSVRGEIHSRRPAAREHLTSRLLQNAARDRKEENSQLSNSCNTGNLSSSYSSSFCLVFEYEKSYFFFLL